MSYIGKIHLIYIILFILLLISYLHHLITHKELPLPKAPNKKPKPKTYNEYINVSHAGLIRGIIFGLLLGANGIENAIQNAAIYGTMNPFIMYLGY